MKIAICAVGGRNKYSISSTFRNSDYFIILNTNYEKISEEIINNSNSFVGSEVFSAQRLINKGVDVVVCGFCEDDAKKLFCEADIKVIENAQGNVNSFSANFLLNYVKAPAEYKVF